MKKEETVLLIIRMSFKVICALFPWIYIIRSEICYLDNLQKMSIKSDNQIQSIESPSDKLTSFYAYQYVSQIFHVFSKICGFLSIYDFFAMILQIRSKISRQTTILIPILGLCISFIWIILFELNYYYHENLAEKLDYVNIILHEEYKRRESFKRFHHIFCIFPVLNQIENIVFLIMFRNLMNSLSIQ
ncbi:hypothetical protein HZS_2587, partial [Henneguya salminicola]